METNGKTYIIGDIHGCAKALNRLLERLAPDAERDRLILLGDLFDRGPDSWEVLQKVQALADIYGDRFVLLLGNHEDYLLAEKLTLRERFVWERVGRSATAQSFRQHGEEMESAAPWLREHCQLWYSGDGFQCAHAGIRQEPLEELDRYTLVHDHDIVLRNNYTGLITITGHIALDMPTWFTGDGERAEMQPFGEWRTLPATGVLCIDTGCGKGGRLTGMILTGDSETGYQYRLESVQEA